ncbi:MAG: bifunctional hydroxymethylpyrimidine kinase/phosphomethylpyrimidine kinase, partial [Burkholderiaceae bacterium]
MTPDTNESIEAGCAAALALSRYVQRALAAELAKGLATSEAVRVAKVWLAEAVRTSGALSVGTGHGPVHHF